MLYYINSRAMDVKMKNNKYDAVKEAVYLIVPNIEELFKTKITSITLDSFLKTISKDEYNLSKDLQICSSTVSKILSTLFPSRPKTPGKVCTYILAEVGHKYCFECKEVKPFEDYSKNKARRDGYSDICKPCFLKITHKAQIFRSAKYRAARLNRTPKWADLSLIKVFYDNCPEGYHVDHIIPLQGELVSGLHTLENLQYLLAKENIQKNNKYIVD